MRARNFFASFALLLGVSVAGCHASPTDICNKSCERTVSCVGGTTQNIEQCKANANCSGADAQSSDCTSDSLNAANDCVETCLDKPCNEILGCLAGCPKCVKK